MERTRRELVRALALGGVTGLAGCGLRAGDAGTETDAPEDTPVGATRTPGDATATATEESSPAQTTTAPPAQPRQVAELAPESSNGTVGESVAMAGDGSVVVAGAPNFAGPGGEGSGALFVFERGESEWAQAARVVAADGRAGGSMGRSLAVSTDASVAVAGAPGSGSEMQGRAYVFAAAGGTWAQEAALAPGDQRADTGLGVALSADGTTALVGSPSAATQGGDARPGMVSVYDRAGGEWTRQTTLTRSALGDGAGFGEAVALSADGTTALVGSPGAGDAPSAGVADVFTRADGGWRHAATLPTPTPAQEDYFGRVVALSDDGGRALVAAPQDNQPTGTDGGAVYVFDRNGGNWRRSATIVPQEASGGAAFGTAAALSGDGSTVVGTSPFARTRYGARSGSAHAFRRSDSGWGQFGRLGIDDGETGHTFGESAALSDDGHLAAVGHPGDQDEVYLFAL